VLIAALARIDQALQQVNQALGTLGGANGGGAKPVRPPAPSKAPAAAKPVNGPRPQRGSYRTTGEQSILALIRQRGGATTQEIKERWTREKRGGTADNILSLLVKQDKLKRTPLPAGQRGSRYTIA
jgi:hypothetical protein